MGLKKRPNQLAGETIAAQPHETVSSASCLSVSFFLLPLSLFLDNTAFSLGGRLSPLQETPLTVGHTESFPCVQRGSWTRSRRKNDWRWRIAPATPLPYCPFDNARRAGRTRKTGFSILLGSSRTEVVPVLGNKGSRSRSMA